VVKKQLPAVDVDPLNNPLQRSFCLDEIPILAGKFLKPRFNLLKFIERLEVDGSDVIDLVAELSDFLLDCLRSGAEAAPCSALASAVSSRCRSRPAFARQASAVR